MQSGCLPWSRPRHCSLSACRDHQTRSRRVVIEGGAQQRLIWGSVQWEQHFGISRLFPSQKKADDVSSCQTGKFWEKWRNPGGKSALCCSCQGKAAQGMRVTSQGMLCASGNPLLKDFQLIEKVKHTYSCWKRGCTTFIGHFSYKGNCS